MQDILTRQRDEVFGVLLSTFNKELYEKNLKQDAYEEGFGQGAHDTLLKQVKIKLSKGKTIEEIADALEESTDMIQLLVKEVTETL